MDTPHCSAQTRAKVRSDGRWGGAVCHRRFPEDSLVELAPHSRELLAETWMIQAATEARVAESFAAVREALHRLGADSALQALAQRAIDDEHRHAALCEEVAGRCLGRPVPPHVALPTQRPRHASAASTSIRDALWVVGQCALNETLAGAYLSVAREGATTPLARHALRELLEDEIDHARVGWAFLSELTEEEKRPLHEWVLPLTISNFREWSALELPSDESLASHGVPAREAVDAAIREAIHGVLVPGFGHVGLDTRALEGWLRRGAPLPEARGPAVPQSHACPPP